MSVTILCSSARLARSLSEHLRATHRQQGSDIWEGIEVLPWQAWLSQRYEQLSLIGGIPESKSLMHLLTSLQEELLWEQAIRQCLKNEEMAVLFDTAGLASVAMEANRYWHEWQLPLKGSAWLSDESKHFVRWSEQFQKLCKDSQSLPASEWIPITIDALSTGAGVLPESMQFAGFDQFNPHLRRLKEVLTARGVVVTEYQLGINSAQDIRLIEVSDAEEECRAAVAWASEALAQFPEGNFAIVVPDLEKRRMDLIRLLDDALHPESLLPSMAEVPRLYEVSLGQTLNTWPIVESGLSILRLMVSRQSIDQAEFSRWLNGVYFSASLSEADARAKLDEWIRATFSNQLTFDQFYARLQRDEALPVFSGLSTTIAHIEQMQSLRQSMPKRQSFYAWGAWFAEALTLIGWPGERALSSHEYQASQALFKALQSLTELDVWFSSCSAVEALQRLVHICQQQVFQPETMNKPRLVITGMLEATATPLDGVWLMGMNDHLWPPAARNNPLLPAEMQRDFRTPNASSEVQSQFGRSVFERVKASATQCMLSFAKQEGERLLRVSPFISEMDVDSISTPHYLQSTLAEAMAISKSLRQKEWLDDAIATPIQEGELVAGGANLLRAQAICPAWAFFQYRLGAKALKVAETGLDAAERGSLLHLVMARVFEGKDSQWLQLQTYEALHDLIALQVQDVLTEFALQEQGRFEQAFYALEAERLTRLALAWVWDKERSRQTPFTVEACEQEIKTTIEGISIQLIIDRVDVLEDGRRVVMDYKTSSQLSYQSWSEAAITEPQLPMYAAILLQDQDVAAVCFARLKLGEQRFIGIAAEEDLLPDVEVLGGKRANTFDPHRFPDWSSVLSHWRERFASTARDLRDGKAAVMVEDEALLHYCEVLPLLRLPERQLQFELLAPVNQDIV